MTPPLTLSDLLRLSPAQLDQAYEAASTPTIGGLDGDYDGILLSGRFPPRPRQVAIGFVNRLWLPWRGKSFDGAAQRGSNRLRLAGRAIAIWPFQTRIVPSQFGGLPALLIDYDIPDNPRWLRRTFFDELKQLREGLYLGVGGVRLAGRDRFWFHWALARA